jgi:hypothetical protein
MPKLFRPMSKQQNWNAIWLLETSPETNNDVFNRYPRETRPLA